MNWAASRLARAAVDSPAVLVAVDQYDPSTVANSMLTEHLTAVGHHHLMDVEHYQLSETAAAVFLPLKFPLVGFDEGYEGFEGFEGFDERLSEAFVFLYHHRDWCQQQIEDGDPRLHFVLTFPLIIIQRALL